MRVGVSRVLGSGEGGGRGVRVFWGREKLRVSKGAGRLGAGLGRVEEAGSPGWSRESAGVEGLGGRGGRF